MVSLFLIIVGPTVALLLFEFCLWFQETSAISAALVIDPFSFVI